MKVFLTVFLCSSFAFADQGPAGTGACSHVIGPVGNDGKPMGFTCTDVGGNALLVWNASLVTSDITISGNIQTVNFRAGSLFVSGIHISDGPIAFVGSSLRISGTVTGSSIVMAGIVSSESDVTGHLLGVSGSIQGATGPVTITTTGKVQATSGDLIIGGGAIVNLGTITAKNGSLIATAGTEVEVGWNKSKWIAGSVDDAGTGPSFRNDGLIIGQNARIEAHRTSVSSIFNRKTINISDTITLVTGLSGELLPNGNYNPNSFGVGNAGTMKARKVVIEQYYMPPPGGSPAPRTFVLKNAADRLQLQTDIGGIIIRQTDNTPAATSATVIDSTQTTTSSIVIPQLAPSMTHLNATSQVMKPTLVASTGASEQVRGTSTQAVTTKPKSRVKAKPVLVRGAFFDSKISATITPNP